MLQSTPLPKVYGHGHIKKFWLMQNQKDTENKVILAPSNSRNNGSSASVGHESKQGPQFSVGNANTRTHTKQVPARPLVSGPACFSMAMQSSLVTCAESLSPPSYMEQSRNLTRSPSPNISSSFLKEEKRGLVVDADGMPMKSPCIEDSNPADKFQWSGFYGSGDQLASDFRSPFILKEESFDNVIDGFSSSKDPKLNGSSLQQEGYLYGETSDNMTSKEGSLGASKCSLGFFSELKGITPFAVPFQLPEIYFSELEAKTYNGAVSKVGVQEKAPSGSSPPIKKAVPSSFPRAGEPSGADVHGEAHKEDGLCNTVLRTCSVCGTSKTPLWRSGPQGPKSLCNACGIRFKKARRGPSDSTDASPTNQLAKSPLKTVKRKQDSPLANVGESPVTNCDAAQVVKKRRWSQPLMVGESLAQKGEVTGNSIESSVTCNLHSPSTISSPSISHFERLSIDENSTVLNVVAGKDEEEAAVLLMYMSWGLVFAQ